MTDRKDAWTSLDRDTIRESRGDVVISTPEAVLFSRMFPHR